MVMKNARLRAGSRAARAGIVLSAALLAAACSPIAASVFEGADAPPAALRNSARDRAPSDGNLTAASAATPQINPKYLRQQVNYPTREPPGTVVVDPDAKFLYLVMADGTALRYGIGVGREGFGWSGAAEVARKAQWPRWTPPAAMIRRQPELERYRNGMDPVWTIRLGHGRFTSIRTGATRFIASTAPTSRGALDRMSPAAVSAS
jgi:lipoprotein-anchoring transpeptidase ErfK/SrfK